MTSTGSNTVTPGDILAGEVWICSGQSNTEHPLERRQRNGIPPPAPGVTDVAERANASARIPEIRLVRGARNTSAAEADA